MKKADLSQTLQLFLWFGVFALVPLKSLQSRAWAIEGASITTLRRDGWTQESIQVGDELTMRCHPLKDGSRGCLLGYITLDDGSEKEFD